MGNRVLKIPARHYDMIRYAVAHMAEASTEMLELANAEIDTILCDEDREDWIEILLDLDHANKKAHEAI